MRLSALASLATGFVIGAVVTLAFAGKQQRRDSRVEYRSGADPESPTAENKPTTPEPSPAMH